MKQYGVFACAQAMYRAWNSRFAGALWIRSFDFGQPVFFMSYDRRPSLSVDRTNGCTGESNIHTSYVSFRGLLFQMKTSATVPLSHGAHSKDEMSMTFGNRDQFSRTAVTSGVPSAVAFDRTDTRSYVSNSGMPMR